MNDVPVISRRCRDCVDGACMTVCPVECIYEEIVVDGERRLPNQLFIHPDDCISCGCCVPECPWEAIFDEGMIPKEFEDDIALNALTAEQPERFHVAVERLTDKPTEQEVQANHRKWSGGGRAPM